MLSEWIDTRPQLLQLDKLNLTGQEILEGGSFRSYINI
jgi:hypothetical protein